MNAEISDFYEEDESPEKIHTAFERGEKGLTAKRHPDLNGRAGSIGSEAVNEATVPDGGVVQVPSDVSTMDIHGVRVEGEAQRFQVSVSRR